MCGVSSIVPDSSCLMAETCVAGVSEWSDVDLKINGIYFVGNTVQSTWEDRLSKLEQRLDDFRGQNFTLLGKAAIINCFI